MFELMLGMGKPGGYLPAYRWRFWCMGWVVVKWKIQKLLMETGPNIENIQRTILGINFQQHFTNYWKFRAFFLRHHRRKHPWFSKMVVLSGFCREGVKERCDFSFESQMKQHIFMAEAARLGKQSGQGPGQRRAESRGGSVWVIFLGCADEEMYEHATKVVHIPKTLVGEG